MFKKKANKLKNNDTIFSVSYRKNFIIMIIYNKF